MNRMKVQLQAKSINKANIWKWHGLVSWSWESHTVLLWTVRVSRGGKYLLCSTDSSVYAENLNDYFPLDFVDLGEGRIEALWAKMFPTREQQPLDPKFQKSLEQVEASFKKKFPGNTFPL